MRNEFGIRIREMDSKFVITYTSRNDLSYLGGFIENIRNSNFCEIMQVISVGKMNKANNNLPPKVISL